MNSPSKFATTGRLKRARTTGPMSLTFLTPAAGSLPFASANRQAQFNQPFALAGLILEAVKGGLLDAIKDTANEKELAKIIKSADAKTLLELRIALGQP